MQPNKVILSTIEYQCLGTVVIGADYFTSIKIIGHPDRNYLLKNGGGFLYNTDMHGNIRDESKYYIENLNKVNQRPIKEHRKLFI